MLIISDSNQHIGLVYTDSNLSEFNVIEIIEYEHITRSADFDNDREPHILIKMFRERTHHKVGMSSRKVKVIDKCQVTRLKVKVIHQSQGYSTRSRL